MLQNDSYILSTQFFSAEQPKIKWEPRYIETSRRGDVVLLRQVDCPARRRRVLARHLLTPARWSPAPR